MDIESLNGSSDKPPKSYHRGIGLDALDLSPSWLMGQTDADMPNDQQAYEELRALLVSAEQAEIEALRDNITMLQARNTDEWLLGKMTPLVTRVIEKQIRESPKDVIEILYPLLGGMVNRAVKEAIRNLVDRIDTQRSKAFNFRHFFSRFRAESHGVSGGAADFRDALPFSVDELFVIHSASGLLIHHESCDPEQGHDSDIIGAMLTAIGDFVQEAFGHNTEGKLEEIEYGDKRILLEQFQHIYVAVVVDGIEPSDYRHEIRRRMIALENTNRQALTNYDGNSAELDIRVHSLQKLLLAG